jgi:hypothetical protein
MYKSPLLLFVALAVSSAATPLPVGAVPLGTILLGETKTVAPVDQFERATFFLRRGFYSRRYYGPRRRYWRR